MCDYSLQGLPNRLAGEGEQLVTHRFPTQSIGLASPLQTAAGHHRKPETKEHRSWWSALKCWLNPEMELKEISAVCLPPGARLRINHVPEEMQRDFALDAVEEVTFVQLSANAYQYRDAVRFRNWPAVAFAGISRGSPIRGANFGLTRIGNSLDSAGSCVATQQPVTVKPSSNESADGPRAAV